VSDDFRPEDIAEISASLERAELEETTSVCSYVELPYKAAQRLVDLSRAWVEDNNWYSALELLDFATQFADSLAICIKEAEEEG
jgi:hypothetical protein